MIYFWDCYLHFCCSRRLPIQDVAELADALFLKQEIISVKNNLLKFLKGDMLDFREIIMVSPLYDVLKIISL